MNTYSIAAGCSFDNVSETEMAGWILPFPPTNREISSDVLHLGLAVAYRLRSELGF
jgi:hypothetical protein